jgi:DNA-binding transcriptional MerR regulator
MIRYEEFLKKITEEFGKDSIIAPEEFPKMELYSDQIVSFINSELSLYGKSGGEILTKTMLSNYVKNGLLPSPSKKKYDKEQMIMLELILCLKNAFKMDDIKILMKPFIESRESTFDEAINFTEIYEKLEPVYAKKRKETTEELMKDIDVIKESVRDTGINDDDMTEMFLYIMILALKIDTAKFIGKTLIREYYASKKDKVKKPSKSMKTRKK